MRDENFLQNASNEECELYPSDLTSSGHSLDPLDNKKSTS